MRNRYSLVYAWTVARIRASSRLAKPESLYWRGFAAPSSTSVERGDSELDPVDRVHARALADEQRTLPRARLDASKPTNYVRYATFCGRAEPA